MICITLFPASNCIRSISPSRKEDRETLEFLRSPDNEVYKFCTMGLCVSLKVIIQETIFNATMLR